MHPGEYEAEAVLRMETRVRLDETSWKVDDGMWQHDWMLGLIGGLMIGLAAVVLLAANGRIMGASGLLGGLIDGSGRENRDERLVFIAALIVAPAIAVVIWGVPLTHATSNVAVLVAGGLLVGLGTRMGSGCTSGHGVCGISRLSLRSIVATVFYILAGGMMMVFARHVLGVI
jgi:uncharacterized membrane protein YedE/YeeE